MDTIKHYSSFPATGVSLRQMVQFGERPSTGGASKRIESCVFILTIPNFRDSLSRISIPL